MSCINISLIFLGSKCLHKLTVNYGGRTINKFLDPNKDKFECDLNEECRV